MYVCMYVCRPRYKNVCSRITAAYSLDCHEGAMINCRLYRTELPDLHYLLYRDNAAFDCLFFTESWLHVNFPDSLLDPAGKYTVVRKNRQSGSGGGVCALISKSLRCVALEQFSQSDVDIICLDIIRSSTKIRFILFYRPPVGCIWR